MAIEGIAVEGEPQEQHSNPEIARDKIESRARSKGWAPEGEWRGNPEDWVDAKEFLGRQKLFDRIDSLKEAMKSQKKSFEEDFKTISKAFTEMNEVNYKRALEELKARRAIAIEDRDLKAVDALDTEIDETKQRLAETKASKDKPKEKENHESEEFLKFKEANSWYTEDSEMRDDAHSIGIGYAAKNPNKTEEEVYSYVAARIKKMYPEKFEASPNVPGEKKEKATVSNVEGSTRAPVTRTKKGVAVEDLSETDRNIMKTLIKRGVFKELAAKNKRTEVEEYLAQYQSNTEQTR